MRFTTAILLFVFTILSLVPTPTHAVEIPDAIKTANVYHEGGTVLDDPAVRAALAKYDLLVLGPNLQEWNQDFLQELRRKNPDIILLAYVPTISWNNVWTSNLHQKLRSGIRSDYWLKDANGNQISIWPGTEALNLSTGWSDTLADWVKNDVMSSGYWDGVFYDEVSAEISWVPNVDMNQDGRTDSASEADQSQLDGLKHLFEKTRGFLSDDQILFMNGSSHHDLIPLTNGRMYETFPTPWEGSGTWSEVTTRYIDQMDDVSGEPVFIINRNVNGTQNQEDYQSMRFGLASTLLADGFYSFDNGESTHTETWYYDEYDVYLGDAVEDPTDLLNENNTTILPSVWERDYEEGKALVNSTDQDQHIRLDGDYERLHGTQDPSVNNGRIVSSLTLPALDGLILLRPIEELFNTVFTNGAFVRIFAGNGTVERTGFFAYDSIAPGNTQVVTYDLDFDGKLETVVADESQVRIYEDNGSLHASFFPYGEGYRLGVNISIGDLESDGSIEIVTGTENGGGPQLRIFNKDGNLIHPGFFAFHKDFRGGVNIAIGDLEGDGTMEVIAGAGVGGGAHVQIFNKDGRLLSPGFFATDPNNRWGVNVAAGDFDGDGIDEIATAQGRGGTTEVRVYDKNGTLLTPGFFAYDESDRGGVELSATDIDGDGVDEIVAIGDDVFTLQF